VLPPDVRFGIASTVTLTLLLAFVSARRE